MMSATPTRTSTMFFNDDSNFCISQSSLFLSWLLTEALWFNICVNKRCERIHDQNGERHTFWIATPVADNDGQKTDTNSINEHTLVSHWRGNIISCHKDGTEHQTST